MRSWCPRRPWRRHTVFQDSSSSPCPTRWPAGRRSRSATWWPACCRNCCGSSAWRPEVGPVTEDGVLVDPSQVREAMEYYAGRGWTDGLPVVPVTESYLAGFLAQTGRDPDEVLLAMPHLNRKCTVRDRKSVV